MPRPSPESAQRARRRKLRSLRLPDAKSLRWTLIGAGVAAMIGSPFAVGAVTKTQPVKAGKRTPAKGSLKTTTRIVTKTAGYGLTLSNSASGGGGALFSCKAAPGGTQSHKEPCLRAANSGLGSVFEFSFKGALGGVFQIGSDLNRPFPNARPFVTNATGVATGLNADRVDGLHADDIIQAAVERSSVQVGAQGPQGSEGPQGIRGPQGLQGPSGAPGTPLIAAKTTATNADFGGQRVVDLPVEAIDSTEPTSGADGVDLVPAVTLTEGTYIVQVTLRAFDLDQENTTSATQFGVADVFLGSTSQGSVWTAAIPADGTNAGQGSSSVVVTVPAGEVHPLSLKGVVRTTAADPGAGTSLAQGGATVIVTEVNPA
jgi:hypothetical protein